MISHECAQYIGFAGAFILLGAHAAVMSGRLSTRGPAHSALNVLASSLLAANAFVENQPAFVLLEITWAAVSAAPLISRLRGRDSS